MWLQIGDVTVTNGSVEIVVNDSTPLTALRPRDGLIIDSQDLIEVKSVASNIITLERPWQGNTISSTSALQVPTGGDFAEAAANIRDVSAYARSVQSTQEEWLTGTGDSITFTLYTGEVVVFPTRSKLQRDLDAMTATATADSAAAAQALVDANAAVGTVSTLDGTVTALELRVTQAEQAVQIASDAANDVSGVVQSYANSASASAVAASASEAQTALDVTTTADNAASTATDASVSLTSKNEAAASASNASTSETKAAEWAEKSTEVVTGQHSSKTHALRAAASATAAAMCEANAATSETNAATSETNAATSELNAAASETSAASSASSATASAASASTSEANAALSKTDAASSATAAQASESKVTASEAKVTVSEANVTASELATKASETNAATSETNAAVSKTAAKASETSATASATSAAASASSATASASSATASASSASTSETNAAASATSATASATEAVNAKDAAELAAQSLAGGLAFSGHFDASSGIAPATPSSGSSFYKVTVAGTVDGVQYAVGDSIVYDNVGVSWFKIDNTEQVTDVNGQTGSITITKEQLGAASAVHTHPYASDTHNHDTEYEPLGKLHDDRYYTETEMDAKLAAKSNSHSHPYASDTHNHDTQYEPLGKLHDDRYYTETEMDSKLAAKADNHSHPYAATSHTHDDRYFTEAEINTKLAAKADTHSHPYASDSHTHTAAAIGAATSGHTHSDYAKGFNNTKSTGSTALRMYRIAKAVGGSPASGYFSVRATRSGQHSVVNFTVSCAYGVDPEIVLLGKSDYGSSGMHSIRLEYESTYDEYHVQIQSDAETIVYNASNVIMFAENWVAGDTSDRNSISINTTGGSTSLSTATGHIIEAGQRVYSPNNKPSVGDIGAQPAGTYNTVIGTDTDVNTSGATIIDNLYMTDGVITSHGTRALTAGDIGALTTSGKAADSNKLDGIDSVSFLRSDATDYLNATLYMRGDVIAETAYRNRGIFGTYDSYKTQHIWSMGTSYRNHATGSNFGNLYGLAYKHTNNGTGGSMGGGHQVVWCQNGVGTSAMGTNLWTSGTVYEGGTALNTRYLGISSKAADSNLLDGLDLHTGRNNSANKVVRTDGNGYLQVGWINTTSGDTTSALSRVFVDTGDQYLRKCTLSHLKSQMGCTDTNTWRSISTSVTSTSTTVSASSSAVKAAYDRATNTASKSTNGWWKCKSTGLIIQWGQYYFSGGNTTRSTTFPIAFPSYCRSVTVNTRVNHYSLDPMAVYSYSKTGFSAVNGHSSASYMDWIAIGY